MISELLFFMEVLVAGLLAGTMYSLVALGFVLIYKASSTFNFAQGAMVFFAVLAFVGFMELGMPFVIAFIVTCLLMVVVGLSTERFVLRPLMNQSEDTLLMATIGLGYVLEGLAQAVWGVEVRRLDLGIGDFPIPWIADNLKYFYGPAIISNSAGPNVPPAHASATIVTTPYTNHFILKSSTTIFRPTSSFPKTLTDTSNLPTSSFTSNTGASSDIECSPNSYTHIFMVDFTLSCVIVVI